jgi:hypothetical protein
MRLSGEFEMNKGLLFGLMTAVVLFLAACGPAATPAPALDAITIVQSYYQAIKDKQLETAMSFVADDAVFMDQGLVYSGKSEIQASVESAINDFVSIVPSNLRETDGRVTYDYEVFQGENRSLSETGALMIVRDGKIIFDGTEEDWIAACDQDASQTFCAER